MFVTMSEKTAHRIAVVLQAICFLAVLFFALAAVLVLMGRVQMTLHTPEGSFKNVLMMEKDHNVTSRALYATMANYHMFLTTDGNIGFITWLGVSLMGILKMFPVGFSFFMLMRFFGNIAQGKVFVAQNAKYLKTGGMALVGLSVITPFVNGFLLPRLINLLSQNQLTVSFSVGFSQLFYGFILLVMAYVFSYGLYLQDEVDHTL